MYICSSAPAGFRGSLGRLIDFLPAGELQSLTRAGIASSENLMLILASSFRGLEEIVSFFCVLFTGEK